MKGSISIRRLVASLVLAAALLGVTTASVAAAEATAVTGKVKGYFHRDCFACGNLARYIAAKNVWCGWQSGHVVVHVTFRNRSAERVTVTWHPSYTIRRGDDHGTGLTSLQDTKLNSGQMRSVLVSQSPHGVSAGSAIAVCKPSFYLVSSG
jgi:hypothetical protein